MAGAGFAVVAFPYAEEGEFGGGLVPRDGVGVNSPWICYLRSRGAPRR